ncbi:HNH endonuclease signature motif containing protein [Romboutsia sp. 1001285H_161024_C4]|uniref:HNH endonuclease signature motif containing protein n=1 Tax=Romboutsia sp. 1001285H_161024_C4 TaxID=2787109 RepID=UPI001896BB0A|nr:HNH endonuclease signature motif containing protein [Romboutsia sp. 1001285H_161024_C4]
MAGRPKGTKNSELHIWSSEEKEYLSEITPGRSHKEILELMNSKFEYQFSLNQIKGAIKRYKLNTGRTGQFEKGQASWNKGTKGLTKANKTSFKKGNRPSNYKPVGSERVNIEGYVEIKVAEPRKWKLKHRVVWEEHNGQIPKGYNVIFADGDKSNICIENLLLVTRKQLLTLNQYGLIKQDPELTKTGINIANVIGKINEVKKRK